MTKMLLFYPLLILAIMSGCSDKKSNATSKSGNVTNGPTNKVLKIGMTQEFENLNPLVKQMMATTYIYDMVGRKLVFIDEAGKWQPQLVEQIPTIENGLAKLVDGKDREGKPGKKIIATWKIKDNAVWGDGTPVTGHDVKFSWNAGQSDDVSVGEKETYQQIQKIDVDPTNPKIMTFTYEKAKWDFNQLGTFYIVPKHIEGPIFTKFAGQKGEYEKNSAYVKDASNPALYNGPFLVKELKLGSHIILVKNPKFFGKAASIEQIVLKLIPNTGTLESNLRSGNIDMISILGFTLDQAIAFEKKATGESLPFKVNFKQGLVYEHIDLQLSNPLLSNVKVRKALVHAIDRKKLTDALFQGKQQPAIHNIAPIDPWFTNDSSKIVTYESSKRKSSQLLEESGWLLNSKDGYRYKDGKKLSFQFMTTSGNKLRELVQVFLQNQWKQVGVEVSIKNEPPRVYFGETVRKSKYPAMAMYAWISSPENTPRSTLHSSSIPSKKNGFSGQNSPRWSNSKVDKLIEAIDVEFDFEKRKDLAQQVLYHYTNDVPVIPLYYRSDISVTPKGLKGYALTGHQFTPANKIEYWTF